MPGAATDPAIAEASMLLRETVGQECGLAEDDDTPRPRIGDRHGSVATGRDAAV
jgi:hypothetical protein